MAGKPAKSRHTWRAGCQGTRFPQPSDGCRTRRSSSRQNSGSSNISGDFAKGVRTISVPMNGGANGLRRRRGHRPGDTRTQFSQATVGLRIRPSLIEAEIAELPECRLDRQPLARSPASHSLRVVPANRDHMSSRRKDPPGDHA